MNEAQRLFNRQRRRAILARARPIFRRLAEQAEEVRLKAIGKEAGPETEDGPSEKAVTTSDPRKDAPKDDIPSTDRAERGGEFR